MRFYRDFLFMASNSKAAINYLKIRKLVLFQLQRTNYSGLLMDKIVFNFDQWSSVINKVFTHFSNYSQILNHIQITMEALCKKNQKIKHIKESLNKVTMTTLVETILYEMTVLDENFNNEGVHDVDVLSPMKYVEMLIN